MTTAKRSLSSLKTAPVEITAGEGDSAEVFFVQHDLLTLNSTYFEGALRFNFREAREHKVRFSDVSPDVMGAFVLWLYTDKLYEAKDPETFKRDASNEDEDERTDVALTLHTLHKTWVWGDRIGTPSLQNAAMDAIQLRCLQAWISPCSTMNHVYANTMPGAQLRTYSVAFCARTMGSVQLRQHPGNPLDFLLDLSAYFCDHRGEDVSIKEGRIYATKLDLCAFHIHHGTDCKGRAVAAQASAKKEAPTPSNDAKGK